MKKRGIIFTVESIRAILDGHKTMTRRVVKPQPDSSVTALVPRTTHAGNVLWGNALWETKKYGTLIEMNDRKCPYGEPGDKLFVRETHSLKWDTYDSAAGEHPGVWYAADFKDYSAAGKSLGIRWRPSIFMPRWASRILLEVTAVKVERLQDISEADTLAEGVELGSEYWYSNYQCLWNEINAKRAGCSWADSPWVWAISFGRVTP